LGVRGSGLESSLFHLESAIFPQHTISGGAAAKFPAQIVRVSWSALVLLAEVLSSQIGLPWSCSFALSWAGGFSGDSFSLDRTQIASFVSVNFQLFLLRSSRLLSVLFFRHFPRSTRFPVQFSGRLPSPKKLCTSFGPLKVCRESHRSRDIASLGLSQDLTM